MLSYQHIYHAGNLADVHKHALLTWMLDYLAGKDKPLTYIDTHAGRGLYRLDAAEAVKMGEAAAGIGRLEKAFPTEHPYVRRLAEVRARFGTAAYPGSPMIAALSLRPGDAIHLFEMHPREHVALAETMAPFGARVRKADGVSGTLALSPPTPRRGLVLVDPSWEMKEDYAAIPRFMTAIRRKWNVSIVAVWYPILSSGRHLPMVEAMRSADPGALVHEVSFGPARDGHRMVGSGLFVANPPWGLDQAAADVGRIFKTLSAA